MAYGSFRYGSFRQAHRDYWLNNSNWSKTKYDFYRATRYIPIYNTWVDNQFAERSNREYLSRYGMNYSDIHDPRNLWKQGGERVIRLPVPQISANVNQLYRDSKKKYHKNSSYTDVSYG